MRLTLMRHGIAHDSDDPACPRDELRALTDDGIDKVRSSARGLRIAGARPSRVLTSPLLRCTQTALIVAEVLDMEPTCIITTEALQPNAASYAVYHALHAFQNDEVLCIGHRPHIDMVLALAIGRLPSRVTALKKAGAAMLEVDQLPRPDGELLWLMGPKLLAALR